MRLRSNYFVTITRKRNFLSLSLSVLIFFLETNNIGCLNDAAQHAVICVVAIAINNRRKQGMRDVLSDKLFASNLTFAGSLVCTKSTISQCPRGAILARRRRVKRDKLESTIYYAAAGPSFLHQAEKFFFPLQMTGSSFVIAAEKSRRRPYNSLAHLQSPFCRDSLYIQMRPNEANDDEKIRVTAKREFNCVNAAIHTHTHTYIIRFTILLYFSKNYEIHSCFTEYFACYRD